MNNYTKRYDPADVDWHHVVDDGFGPDIRVNYEYSILGYNLDDQRLDMLMRFTEPGTCCEPHNHVASTTVLILEGEQRLRERQSDGTFKEIIRKAGEYALTPADALPHLEGGGENGCTLLLSLHAPDGILFKVFNPELTEGLPITIEEFVTRWEARP